jgi:hypothetical protein
MMNDGKESAADSRNRTARGQNLSREDRVRGGEHSAKMQRRDRSGRFAGAVGQQGRGTGGEQQGQGRTDQAQEGGGQSSGGGEQSGSH